MHYSVLSDYLIARRTAFEQNIFTALQTADVDAIHDYRVAVKRIKMLVNMTNTVSPQHLIKASKHLKKIKSVYKPGGFVRDAQVQQQLCTDYEQTLQLDFAVYTEKMKKDEKAAIKLMNKAIEQFEIKHFDKLECAIYMTIRKIKPDELKKYATNYIEAKFDRIFELIKTEQSEHVLHEIRRQLKEATYLAELLRNIQELTPGAEKIISEMKKLGSELGDWHDRLVMQHHIQTLRKKQQKKLSPLFEAAQKDRVSIEENLHEKLAACSRLLKEDANENE